MRPRPGGRAAGYFSPKDWEAPEFAQGGLRPRWSPCGRYLAFDSAHVWGTGLQMYVTGVQLAGAQLPRQHAPPQRSPPTPCALLSAMSPLDSASDARTAPHTIDGLFQQRDVAIA